MMKGFFHCALYTKPHNNPDSSAESLSDILKEIRLAKSPQKSLLFENKSFPKDNKAIPKDSKAVASGQNTLPIGHSSAVGVDVAAFGIASVISNASTHAKTKGTETAIMNDCQDICVDVNSIDAFELGDEFDNNASDAILLRTP